MNLKPTILAAAATAMLLSGCTAPAGSSACKPYEGTPVTIDIDGSSTVYPIAEAWAEEFASCAGIDANVAFSGTGGGFQKFCRGEIDVADASRPIKAGAGSESENCQKAGIAPFEIQVAIDGLAVVVSKENTWVTDLKVTELNKIWTANASKQSNTWKDVRSAWPAETIQLFGPGTNSGTYDYWKEAIVHPFDGSSATTRSDYTPSEDDNVLVTGVAGTKNGLGFFGLAYATENAGKVRIVPIANDGKGSTDQAPHEPTPASVEGGLYKPLARPLFMYTNGAPTGQLKSWLQHGLSPAGQEVVGEVGYVKLPEAKRLATLAKLG